MKYAVLENDAKPLCSKKNDWKIGLENTQQNTSIIQKKTQKNYQTCTHKRDRNMVCVPLFGVLLDISNKYIIEL